MAPLAGKSRAIRIAKSRLFLTANLAALCDVRPATARQIGQNSFAPFGQRSHGQNLPRPSFLIHRFTSLFRAKASMV
jgi:hypothetical protein